MRRPRRGLRAGAARRRACGRSSRAATGGGSRSGPVLIAGGVGCCCSRPPPRGRCGRLSDPGAALGLVPGELQAAADPPAEGRDFDAGDGRRVLDAGDGQQHPGHARGVRRRDPRAASGRCSRCVFNGTDARGGRRARVRRRQRRRVPAPDLLARAARAVVHRRRRRRRAAAGLGDHRAGPAGAAGRVARRARRGSAVELALGTAPWLVLCGVAEGFADRAGAAGRGAGRRSASSLFALFWGLVVWRGRTSTRAERRVSLHSVNNSPLTPRGRSRRPGGTSLPTQPPLTSPALQPAARFARR